MRHTTSSHGKMPDTQFIKLTNGAPGSSQCLKNIHPKFLQPCKSHFSVSQCGQDICIKLSGITQLMARTKYLFYPWSDVDYNISGVDIIVHIKEKPTRATTIGPSQGTSNNTSEPPSTPSRPTAASGAISVAQLRLIVVMLCLLFLIKG
ncbi:hypothetical protein OS493_020501 [Desmophyllum pertusum]|uniref:Uncharacterized protein n=1 Tax=Desmophyllum pertusum TaxID=174260 RepID=A0A9W9YYY5_9CNID|nr:hypothetical protein OS493_020501 [Desmophyllum pertusum]